MSTSNELVLEPRKTLTYRVCRSIVAGAARFYFHPTIEGTENIPREGPVLITPIHRSNVDFAFTLFISPRKVFFMAKEGIFRVPLFGQLLTRLGAFPVHRATADRASLRLAEEVLRRGQALVLFPEGTRKDGPVVEALQDGAMFIAARTGATVVPVGIAGSDQAMPVGAKFLHRVKIHVVIGPPIAPPSTEGRVTRSAVSEKSEELRQALQVVYDESRRRRGP